MAEVKIAAVLAGLFRPWLIIYNLSFVYIGVLFAHGITLYGFVLVTIAFMAARLSALLMNRYVDRELDLRNPKKRRNDPSLAVPRDALLAAFVLLSALFVFCAYLLNTLALLLSPIVIALFVIDPMLKTRTSSRHFSVGAIESISPLAGYIGTAGAFPAALPLYLLAAGMVLVGGGFDMLYTIVHVGFDMGHGIRTYAVRYGVKKALRISMASHAIAIAFMILFAVSSGSFAILMGSIGASAILVSEHAGIKGASDADFMRRFNIYNPALAVVILASVFAWWFVTLA